jgi:hypothetical protein
MFLLNVGINQQVHNLEDQHRHLHRRENLRTDMVKSWFHPRERSVKIVFNVQTVSLPCFES